MILRKQKQNLFVENIYKGEFKMCDEENKVKKIVGLTNDILELFDKLADLQDQCLVYGGICRLERHMERKIVERTNGG